jgi:hypothetical protein
MPPEERDQMTRCCARCRTPYNCGHKECRCHNARILPVVLETPQDDLWEADRRNNTRNPHIE